MPASPPKPPLPACALALLGLCLGGAARGDALVPRGEAVIWRQGSGEVPIVVHAVIAARPEAAASAPPAPPPPAQPPPTPGESQVVPPGIIAAADLPQPQSYRFPTFRPDGDALRSELQAEDLAVSLRLSWEAGAGFTLHVQARATAPTWVRSLALEMDIDADGAALPGRDLRPLSLEGAAVLGRLDPKWVTLYRHGRPLFTLVGNDQFDGLQVRRLGPGKGLRLRIDVLSVEARPFFHFANCTNYWKDPNQRLTLPYRLLLPEPGDVQEGDVALLPGAPLPLLKARFPEGRRAALVITDHADQTAAATLRTLAGGTSDAGDPRWGQGGLLGHGLAITKALWLKSGDHDPAFRPEARQPAGPGKRTPLDGRVLGLAQAAELPAGEAPEIDLGDQLGVSQADESGGGRPQLDDPQVVELADRLHAAGWEIIPHSATPMRDSRELTQQALRYFQRYGARTWIDHQPYTNCEALVNQGYRPGRFFISDLLDAQGYRYAWAGLDASPGDLNLLLPRRLDRYAPVLWPAGRLASGAPATLWLFRSMLAFIEAPRFYEMYGAEALDRLERERGLHIAHTYLEDFHPPKSWFGKRNLLVPGPRPREVVLDPRLDALFSALAARVARGSLWVPTLSRLGDHLRAMSEVAVVVETDGTATVRSQAGVPRATFVVPRPGLGVRVDGRPPLGLRHDSGETSFWVDLPAERPVRVQLRTPGGQPLSFLSPP